MTELHLPWLGMAVLVPLAGAAWVRRPRDPRAAQRRCLLLAALALGCAAAAWLDFQLSGGGRARDPWWPAGAGWFVIDDLNAPLLPLAALLYAVTVLATLRTKVRRFSFAGNMVSLALLLATLACDRPWGVVALLALGALPPWFELRARRRPVAVYALHMGLFVALLAAGQALLGAAGPGRSIWAVSLLTAAVLLRSGVVPVHCWMTDLFEHASFSTALLFVTPMVGAYAAVRLVLPVAPDWALRLIALVSLFTAVYAAGMALVQREARRFFCYLFLSHSSLVLVGLEVATPVGLTGALCVWLSVGLSLGGFGLTLRAMEARTGRLSLAEYHGLYEAVPTLAAFFLLTGLASIGFPGTIGFIATELLVDGVVRVYPFVGTAVVLAAALNGIAVVQAYFRIFTGARHAPTVDLRSRLNERAAVLVLTALILGGGLFPGPGVASRYRAAMEVIGSRPGAAPPHAGGGPAAPRDPAKDPARPAGPPGPPPGG